MKVDFLCTRICARLYTCICIKDFSTFNQLFYSVLSHFKTFLLFFHNKIPGLLTDNCFNKLSQSFIVSKTAVCKSVLYNLVTQVRRYNVTDVTESQRMSITVAFQGNLRASSKLNRQVQSDCVELILTALKNAQKSPFLVRCVVLQDFVLQQRVVKFYTVEVMCYQVVEVMCYQVLYCRSHVVVVF